MQGKEVAIAAFAWVPLCFLVRASLDGKRAERRLADMDMLPRLWIEDE